VEACRKSQYHSGNLQKIPILWWKQNENLNIMVGTCRQSKYHRGNLQNISIVLWKHATNNHTVNYLNLDTDV
jgi:hypothetical protein